MQTHSFIETESKIQNLMLISYFISEKSEVLYDIKVNNILKTGKQNQEYNTLYKSISKAAQ